MDQQYLLVFSIIGFIVMELIFTSIYGIEMLDSKANKFWLLTTISYCLFCSLLNLNPEAIEQRSMNQTYEAIELLEKKLLMDCKWDQQ